MISKQHAFLIFPLLAIGFYSSNSNASSASVHSIPVGSPTLGVSGGVGVQTITRGLSAANDPVYRVAVQQVSKTVLKAGLKTAMRVTPYGLAALTAYELYVDLNEDSATYGEIVSNVTVQYGSCSYRGSTIGTDIGEESCKSLLEQQSGDILYPTYYSASIRYKTSGGGWRGDFFFSTTGEETQIADDDLLYDNWIDYMASNPDLDHNSIFRNADGSVNQDFFPNPEFEYYTESDQNLLSLYEAGLLQSSDPTADNYVIPSELQRISELHAELNASQEEIANNLTAAESEPLTQSQHNDNLLDSEARIESSLGEGVQALSGVDLGFDEPMQGIDDNFDQLTQMLEETNALPDSNFLDYFNFVNSSGCSTIDLPFDIVFPTQSQCTKLGYLKEMLGYFLFVMVAWNIITTVLKEAN